jgi:hypothetical protein
VNDFEAQIMADGVGDAWARTEAEKRLAEGDLDGALGALGRHRVPSWLYEKDRAGKIDTSQLRAFLLDAWSGAEYPCRRLPRGVWLDWFARTGFLSDTDTPAPSKPLKVWRSQVGRVFGLAWTLDVEKAQWFHDRNVERGFDSRLLCRSVDPSGVLALINDGQEREVVAHPRSLADGAAK